MQGILQSALPHLPYVNGPSGPGLSAAVTQDSSSRYAEHISTDALPSSDSIMHALKPHGAHVQGCPGHALLSGPDESHARGYPRPALPCGLTTQGSSTTSVGWGGVIPPAITAAASLQQDPGFQLKF